MPLFYPYEIHISIDHTNFLKEDFITEFCKENKLKFLTINLSSGEHKKQCMFTKVIKLCGKDSLEKAKLYSNSLRDKINLAGFSIIRIKMETSCYNPIIPLKSSDINKLDFKYFEFHTKISIDDKDVLDGIKKICKKYNAHLSSNPNEFIDNNKYTWFITKRVHDKGFYLARHMNEKFVQELYNYDQPNHRVEIIKEIEECVVFDSNFDLDRGWA